MRATRPAATGPRPRRIRRVVADVVLGLTALVAVAVTIAIVGLGIGVAPVLSDSMSPTFDAGAVVITMPRSALDLRVGDVPILPVPDGSDTRYAHRIAERTVVDGRIQIRTKGDANTAVDDWHVAITSDDVPVVIASIPRLGWMSEVAGSRTLRLALTVAVAVTAVVGLRRVARIAG